MLKKGDFTCTPCSRITRYLIEHENMPPDTRSPYNTLDTQPLHIHELKDHHHEAITPLNGAIEPWFDQPHADSHEPPMHQPPQTANRR